MATDLPPSLVEVVQRLLRGHPTTIGLDELADAIGDQSVTPPQIAEIMHRLEVEGRAIEVSESLDLPGLLRDVLASARHLQERGDKPTVQAIAEHLKAPRSSVAAALLFARTLSRSG